jgi:hypothetical protein
MGIKKISHVMVGEIFIILSLIVINTTKGIMNGIIKIIPVLINIFLNVSLGLYVLI